ncbi:ferritin-like domain-containing protein [Lacibacterium aquatile]|uniref:Ferritin-like domain-containing protein n=1 Tax=Lacibacterium aquatile TaxID=1168082 RepID=A0ABW5DS49_9PROT
MSITTFNDLFVHALEDIYYAEQQIAKSLPKLVKAAGSPELSKAFAKHLEETKGQIERLKKVFTEVGVPAKGAKCPAIEGILTEADELMSEIKDAEVRDAALVSGAQAVEHYEITRYGTLIAWAEQLGLKDSVKLLKETLKEEEATDSALNKLAISRINKKAA